MSERFGIERCQWQNLSDENSIQWHCHTHGYGIDEDPQGGLCGCAQDQTRAGLAGREEVLPILQDLIAESRAWLAGDHPEPMVWMLDRAERRLREMEDE